jgi:hypothetical protein
VNDRIDGGGDGGFDLGGTLGPDYNEVRPGRGGRSVPIPLPDRGPRNLPHVLPIKAEVGAKLYLRHRVRVEDQGVLPSIVGDPEAKGVAGIGTFLETLLIT